MDVSCIGLEMNWISEWFDKKGRDFNKVMQSDEERQRKVEATGLVSLRDGTVLHLLSTFYLESFDSTSPLFKGLFSQLSHDGVKPNRTVCHIIIHSTA